MIRGKERILNLFIKFNKENNNEYELIEINDEKKLISYKHNICQHITIKKYRLYTASSYCGNKNCIKIRKSKSCFETTGHYNPCKTDNYINSVNKRMYTKRKNLFDKFNKENNNEYKLIEIDIKDKIITYKHVKCNTTMKKNFDTFRDRPGGIRAFCMNAECKKIRMEEECLIKYNISRSQKCKESAKKTRMEVIKKYYYDLKDKFSGKFELLFTLDDYSDRLNKYNKLKFRCLKCKNIIEWWIANGLDPICRFCTPKISGFSYLEKELLNYIKNIYNEKIEDNKRFYFDGNHFHELDIYLPDINTGIEFNGIYWHSELEGKDRHYHIDKQNFFKNLNINLIQVFESEWVNKNEIVKSILKSKLKLLENKIYARNTTVKIISYKDTKIFLNKNHIQGYANSSINLGLFHLDELVSLMTFGKSRYNKNYDYELLRFCNKLNYNIPGAFSKLLKYFKDSYDFKSLISYADKRFSIGNVYLNNGFKLINESKPNYFYFHKNKSNELLSRVKFQKHKLKDKLNVFDENKTEWENMKYNGYNRIWDCGNYVFELIN
jgi:hypothetical protein